MNTSPYHNRIIQLSYFQADLPKLYTQEEVDEWHRAVGRMITYGLRRDETQDTIELILAGLTRKPLELCANYYVPLLATPEKYEDGATRYIDSPAQTTDTLINTLARKSKELGHPFVMAAVLHSDGKWGFHS